MNNTTQKPFNVVAHYAGRPLTLVIDDNKHTHINLRQLAAILDEDDDTSVPGQLSGTGLFIEDIFRDSISRFNLNDGAEPYYLDANKAYVYLSNVSKLPIFNYLNSLVDWLCEQIENAEDAAYDLLLTTNHQELFEVAA
ncbi:hypothetical protein [Methylobacter tundripaludum]|uniref:hypothetical protein n=1 Tax=Methylobacter tundripaludum TaxID=173365 RepID=UPI0004DF1741|nr:hypothetical protein [Methylobacter tundripaludum]